MVVSTLAALAAAALFAVTTNLQRAAAASVPAAGSGPMHLLRRLVRDRRWLAGGLIGVLALGLHAVALARGTVVVVQSVMALGLVIALAVEARREGRRMRAHELGGAALVVAGVATVVAVSRPADPAAFTGRGALACAVVALVAAVAVVCTRQHVGERWGARAMAAMGGACFAVDAVFLQRLAALLDHGGRALPSSGVAVLVALGDLAGFFGASAVGTIAVHRAYQVAPLRAVQPALAAAEPVTAFVVGVALLHEGVRAGALGYALLVLGLLSVVSGIFVGLVPVLAARPVPARPVPAGSVPARPVPARPVPAGSVPAGSVPACSVPAGSVPARPVPVARPVRTAPPGRVPVLAGASVVIREPARPVGQPSLAVTTLQLPEGIPHRGAVGRAQDVDRDRQRTAVRDPVRFGVWIAPRRAVT